MSFLLVYISSTNTIHCLDAIIEHAIVPTPNAPSQLRLLRLVLLFPLLPLLPLRLVLPPLDSKQLPRKSRRITTRKPPPRPMPHPNQIHHTPTNRLRHPRPLDPRAILKRPISIQQEKRQNVQVSCFSDGVFTPCFKHVPRKRGLERIRRWSVRVSRHCGHGGYFVVQVSFQISSKRVHYTEETLWAESSGFISSVEVVLVSSEAG